MIQAKEREKSSRHGPSTKDDRHDRHEGPRIADSTSQLTDGDGLPRHIRAAHRSNVLLLVHYADAHAVQRGGNCECPSDRDRSFHSGTGVRNFDGHARYIDLRISIRPSLLRCLCCWPCLRQRADPFPDVRDDFVRCADAVRQGIGGVVARARLAVFAAQASPRYAASSRAAAPPALLAPIVDAEGP